MSISLASIGALFISVLMAYSYTSFQGFSSQDIEQFFPESILALFKSQGGFATDANGYLATTYRHPIHLIIVSAFAIGMSSGAVAKEIERNSILLILSCPLARWRFLVAKAQTLCIGLLVLVLGSWLGTLLGSGLIGVTSDIDLIIFLVIALNTFLLALSVGAYTLFISSLSSDGGRTIGISTVITILMLFVDFLSVLWMPASILGPLSIFNYYDPLGIARQGGLPIGDIITLLTVALTFLALAIVIFQRRDVV
jgi:ABC-type transport system involved in multi-copper enzyme maturation permease subunit